MSHHAWVERVIHFPYFLLRRASRTPLLVAVLLLSVLGFGLGEPEANAGANGVVVGIASAGPMITSPAMLRDIGRQIRRSTEQPGPITSPGDAAGIGVALFNRERAAANLPPLSESLALNQVATTRAQQMVTDGLTHIRPGAQEFAATQLLRQNGIAFAWDGENIYWQGGPPFDDAVNAAEAWWMTSPEHRANILGPHFRQVGIGTAIDGGKIYIAAVFADSAITPTPRLPRQRGRAN